MRKGTTALGLVAFGGILWFNYTTHQLRIMPPTDELSKRPTPSVENELAYIPALSEAFLLKNAESLGYFERSAKASGCQIWTNSSSSEIYNDLQSYLKQLEDYNQRLQTFSLYNVTDVRHHLTDNTSNDICSQLRLDPNGLEGIFGQNQHLSKSIRSGFVEPLLPPMRHPKLCFERRKYLLNMEYMVHDFEHMCRRLKKHSRIVLIDMGAALDFRQRTQPAVYLTDIYAKFGLPFDHVFAYEKKPTDPETAYDLIPSKLRASYHWFNVGVESNTTSERNPFKMVKEHFVKDDLIVVKLDIDAHWIEVPLAEQLRDNADELGIDQFYFEHHCFLKELFPDWKRQAKGSIGESMELFSDLRKNGVAAHFWV